MEQSEKRIGSYNGTFGTLASKASNPLQLPEEVFRKLYRLNRAAALYLFHEVEPHMQVPFRGPMFESGNRSHRTLYNPNHPGHTSHMACSISNLSWLDVMECDHITHFKNRAPGGQESYCCTTGGSSFSQVSRSMFGSSGGNLFVLNSSLLLSSSRNS